MHEPDGPAREVIQADALTWLREHPARMADAIVTSLPDLSELPQLGPGLEGWQQWFVAAAAAVLRWPAPSSVSIFYQSDIRHAGRWIDKAYLVQKAAEGAGASLLFHKIVCRRAPGSPSLGRASYSHLLAFTTGGELALRRPTPDVLPDAGDMPWSRAMGTHACELSCRFLLDETTARRVVDPFCGKGTVLAVANALGLRALGIDVSAKRCRAARKLDAAALKRDPRPLSAVE